MLLRTIFAASAVLFTAAVVVQFYLAAAESVTEDAHEEDTTLTSPTSV